MQKTLFKYKNYLFFHGDEHNIVGFLDDASTELMWWNLQSHVFHDEVFCVNVIEDDVTQKWILIGEISEN